MKKRLLRMQKQLAGYKLLIIDELGFVPLSKVGSELLFEVFSAKDELTAVTSNLPFDEWTEVFWIALGFSWTPTSTYGTDVLEVSDGQRIDRSEAVLGQAQGAGRTQASSR